MRRDAIRSDPAARVELALEPLGPVVYAGLPCERTDLRSGAVVPTHEQDVDHEPDETGTAVSLLVENVTGTCPGLGAEGDGFLVYGMRFDPPNRDRVTVAAWYTGDLELVSSRAVWDDATGRHVSESAVTATMTAEHSHLVLTFPLWVAQTPYVDAEFFAATSPCAPGQECALDRPDTLTVARHADLVPNVYDARFFTQDGSKQSPALP